MAAPAALVLLFIGNSLSAANDLPAMLEAMGRASGVPIRCAIVAKPNFSLEICRAAAVAVAAVRAVR